MKKRRKKKKFRIYIKPSRRGSLRKIAKVKPGQKIPLSTLRRLAKSKDPRIRRKAIFALNARKWGHGRRKKKKRGK